MCIIALFNNFKALPMPGTVVGTEDTVENKIDFFFKKTTLPSVAYLFMKYNK